MGVYESCAKLKQSSQDLNMLWDQTKAQWQDVKAKEFEEQFVNQLGIEIKKAETALQAIAPLLNRIHSELKE